MAMNISTDYHRIWADPPPERYARGWHCIGLSEKFRDGKPHAIEAFGTKLVVFESEDGQLNVLNAYCPHMGADLCGGRIVGDAIACPFHDWRWRGDGTCAGIPYARRIPPKAKTKAWYTMEENDQLFVWHDPEENPPIPEQKIPNFRERFPGTWSPWYWEETRMQTNCRELIDNLADLAHFFYVHGERRGNEATYFKNIFEGHVAAQFMEHRPVPEGMIYDRGAPFDGEIPDAPWTRSEAVYHGPAYMIDPQWLSTGTEKWTSMLINAHYPIDQHSFMLLLGLSTRYNPEKSTEENEDAARRIAKKFRDGFFQDVAIWENKTRIDNPLLCDTDGPIARLRHWYQQFYVDVADIKPGMVRRREFEPDIRHAQAAWRKQREETLRQDQERERGAA